MCPNMMKNWDRGAWQATAHEAAKSWTQLGNWAEHVHEPKKSKFNNWKWQILKYIHSKTYYHRTVDRQSKKIASNKRSELSMLRLSINY